LLREDLFYRLRVVPIQAAPAPAVGDDVLLAIFSRSTGRHRRNRTPPRRSLATIEALRTRPWRETSARLQNVIEHVAVIADADRPVQPEHLPVYQDDSSQPQRAAYRSR
jgi:DNA-binding NtrC family response regulator